MQFSFKRDGDVKSSVSVNPSARKYSGVGRKRVMLDPIRHAENAALVEKFSDLKFLRGRVFDPAVDVVGDFQRRHIFVPVLLVSFERDCAIPFLLCPWPEVPPA